jgi:mono/diheme cytochrome c family protein
MRMRGRMSTAAITLSLASLAACGRNDVDVRTPLGAQVVGTKPFAPVRNANAAAFVIPSTANLKPATYTNEQAVRGQQVYQTTCVRCHPPGHLDGETFSVGWNERRVFDLYSLLRNTMPQDKPGSLTDDEYIDVIAYLLQRNHIPASSVALRPDTASLRDARIDVKPAAGGGSQ